MKKSCNFKKVQDERGSLSAFDELSLFNVKRFYLIECNEGLWRGEHHHKKTSQNIFVVAGSLDVEIYKDGVMIDSFVMNEGESYLQIPFYKFRFKSREHVSKLLVLCDENHDKEDYEFR